MIQGQQTHFINFSKGNSNFSFLPTGDIYEFTYDDFMINGYWGNCIDGSSNNIYLRLYEQDKVISYPLLGKASESRISVGRDQLIYTGDVGGISYEVTFLPMQDGIWVWRIYLQSEESKTVDLIYGQDVGVASRANILTNELYTSQYLDHKVIKGSNGYTISSRQNLPQSGCYPYLQQGSLDTEIIGYSTDATQFFGNDYRKTYIPKALANDLPNVNYQFELAYIALQTRRLTWSGDKSVMFYGIFKPDMSMAVTELLYQQELETAYKRVKYTYSSKGSSLSVKIPVLKTKLGKPFVSAEFSKEEFDRFFPQKKFVETEKGKILSFFTLEHAHVVLQQKEVMVERPHGHIITTGMDDKKVSRGLVTSTNYMYGVFHSQLAVGNTSMNKLLSTNRGFLNIQKNAGQRIYLRIDGVYRILTLPAAYEMGINYSKWYYKVKDDILFVSSFALADEPAVVLDVHSMNGIKYDYIVTNQLAMGEHEYIHPVKIRLGETLDGKKFACITKAKLDSVRDPYPDLSLTIHVVGSNCRFSDDRIFYEDNNSRNGTLLTIGIDHSSAFQFILEGRLEKAKILPSERKCLAREFEKFSVFYKKLFGNFHLSLDGEHSGKIEKNEIEKLNEMIWWYTHNAMVHFAVPHGLEQPGGAAWGTRDICQGPMEFFLSTGHYELARDVLVKVFEHQYLETKEWPQWFMFDDYNVQAEEWHGDVVFWPLKCVGDYLAATGDFSILKENIGYRFLADHKATIEKNTMLKHVKEAIEAVKAHFIPNTVLISYAGGDWDDTLQPANPDMRSNMVSAWTESLAYQVFIRLSDMLKKVDPDYAIELADLCKAIQRSFNEILIKNNVITGFAYFKSKGIIDYMLHPDDLKTGIHYRLLPLTRSIISEIVDKKQAEKNDKIIDRKLSFPDGVRLMDRPAHYEGGVTRHFQRAEQAANVGREISLQYVHAHIRYIEAMAKLGNAYKVWKALFQIIPIGIKEVVPNAALRQANAYFSSSDGAFANRYEYQDEFERLRDGSIAVKGGWRIYSSGSGILISQMISNILGIRFIAGGLVIDPVLPGRLNGLHFDFTYGGQEVTFIYHIVDKGSETSVVCGGHVLKTKKLKNPYRQGGVKIDRKLMLAMLETDPAVHIYVQEQ